MTSILQKANNLSFAVVFLTLLVFPVCSYAQDAVSFSVSPTIFDMTANPGQTWRSTIRVINANSYDLKVFVDLNNFIPKGEDGVPTFIPVTDGDEPNSSLAQWITTEHEVTIPAEQTIELPITISLPETAAPGGHFAAVMISTKPTQSDALETNVQTSQVISSLIFLRVSGDISESSSIRSFRTTKYILSKPEATFEIRIENKGNVHVQPQGEIKIFNMWGKERGAIPVNQQTLFGNVLPNSVRKYAFTWNSEWSVTDIGRYTAVATLAYGNEGRQFMDADTAFWIIPWKPLFLVLSIIIGFIVLVTWAIKLYVRSMLKMAGISPAGHIPVSAVEQVAITASKKAKKLSVVTPIEVSILDLRSRLKETHSPKMYLKIIFTFIKTNRIFFAVGLAVIIFISATIWFFSGAFAPSRDFEVTIEQQGKSVTVTSDEIKTESQNAQPPASTTTTLPISIVNRSGDEALTENVKKKLENAGYIVSKTSNDTSSAEDKTVVVYDSSSSDIALALSTLLGNALLSSYQTPEGETAEIVIYIGSDAKVGE